MFSFSLQVNNKNLMTLQGDYLHLEMNTISQTLFSLPRKLNKKLCLNQGTIQYLTLNIKCNLFLN